MKRKFSILILIIILITTLLPSAGIAAPITAKSESRFPVDAHQGQETCETASLHYTRREADYDSWGLHIWGPTSVTGVTWTTPFEPTGEDDYGIFWEVPMAEGAGFLNYIVHRGDEKDPGPDQVMSFSAVGCEIWLTQGKADQFLDPESALESMTVVVTTPPPAGDSTAIIHYTRINHDYEGWGLHIWGPTAVEDITWTSPLMPAGQDDYGIYWIIDMQPNADNLNYIVHKGDQKDPGPDQSLQFGTKGREIWLIEGSAQQFTSPGEALAARAAAKTGDIANKALAFWVAKDYIVWDVNLDPNTDVSIYYDPEGQITLTENGIEGGHEVPLLFAGSQLKPQVLFKFPHLKGMQTFKLVQDDHDLLPEILRSQVVIAAKGPDGEPQGATTLQIPGVLDELYADAAWNETLGVKFDGDTPTIKLWAPTAKSVNLLLFADSTTEDSETIPLEWDKATGIWSVTGTPDWEGKYYLYDVEVFIRQEGAFVHNLVTDPYSFGLSANSARSQVIDLQDPSLMPEGWDDLGKPDLAAFTDIVLYELHLRDFSAIDATVPASERGTYLAFTDPQTAGMQHLTRLQEAGITHIHLLPIFDIATINENKAEWENVDFDELSAYPPDSEEQQTIVNTVRGKDPFNWGYDPFHYTVPEGSYSTAPDGSARVVEFREMVQALNNVGLRVVMDVVYNHTNSSGQSQNSVLDKVVPGYYHRLDFKGEVTNSTCCANTATEHDMMRKLMIDSVLTWAVAYKVDGFRFDLMGHHMVNDMQELRAALDELTVETHGVSGDTIYVYGEGWDFGEVAGNARGQNATQINMAGTGVGTFNDRGRDAVRGGTPFSPKQDQGFATGMYFDPNEANQLSEPEQLDALLLQKDQIRVMLAGNLADYEFVGAEGSITAGADVKYGSSPTGYAHSPEENIIYVSAHDNETLFDALQYKMPQAAAIEERVQAQSLSLSLVAFSQGVPFFHAGSELLRSKSMDRDSYDSTDWFNALDWTYQNNGWGNGLPLHDKNGGEWELIQPLLADPDITPDQEHILQSLEYFEQWLQIRQSSPLFRLHATQQIQDLVQFHNVGPDQTPGLIAMSISDDPSLDLDPKYNLIFVLWNAAPDPVEWKLENWQTGELILHPLITDPHNSEASYQVGEQVFSLPPRSVAVFVSTSPLVKLGIDPKPPAEEGEPTPEPTTEPEVSKPTETPVVQPEPTLSPVPEGDFTENTTEIIKPEQTQLWPFLIGGTAVIAAGLGGWLWFRKKR